MANPPGITNTDYQQILNDFGVTVVRTPVTKTEDNITGDEILTNGSTENVTAYFVRRKQQWQFDKEGQVEGGDAYLGVLPTQTVNKDDIIEHESLKYRVQNVILRQAGDTELVRSCNLFLLDDA